MPQLYDRSGVAVRWIPRKRWRQVGIKGEVMCRECGLMTMPRGKDAHDAFEQWLDTCNRAVEQLQETSGSHEQVIADHNAKIEVLQRELIRVIKAIRMTPVMAAWIAGSDSDG
jgi:hypothetical protein